MYTSNYDGLDDRYLSGSAEADEILITQRVVDPTAVLITCEPLCCAIKKILKKIIEGEYRLNYFYSGVKRK